MALIKIDAQWIAALGVTLLLIHMGGMVGWTSPYLARLTREDSHIHLDSSQASWLASLLNVGRFLGAPVGAICVNFWGSKRALIHTLIPITCSWLLLLLADLTYAAVDPAIVTLPLMYLARMSGGLGLGMAFSAFPLYLGEVARPEIRGAIMSVSFFGTPFGNVLACCIGPYLSMTMSSLIFLIPCAMDIVLFMYMPDAPHYLAKIGDLKAARESIEWYRSGVGVDEELEAVQKYVSSSSSQSYKQMLAEFKIPFVRRALFIIILLFGYMQTCGLNSVLFYMEIIFERANTHIISPSLAVILTSIIGAIVPVVSINLMDKCGRRMLLVVSGLGVSITLTTLGMHFSLQDLGYDSTKFQWLPVISIFLFMAAFIFGLMSVPSVVLSELFPANIKCFVACIAGFAGAMFAFLATKTYQPMIDGFGEAWVFYIYAAITITVVPFTLHFLPETKGKSLQQIQEDLVGKN